MDRLDNTASLPSASASAAVARSRPTNDSRSSFQSARGLSSSCASMLRSPASGPTQQRCREDADRERHAGGSNGLFTNEGADLAERLVDLTPRLLLLLSHLFDRRRGDV